MIHIAFSIFKIVMLHTGKNKVHKLCRVKVSCITVFANGAPFKISSSIKKSWTMSTTYFHWPEFYIVYDKNDSYNSSQNFREFLSPSSYNL